MKILKTPFIKSVIAIFLVITLMMSFVTVLYAAEIADTEIADTEIADTEIADTENTDTENTDTENTDTENTDTENEDDETQTIEGIVDPSLFVTDSNGYTIDSWQYDGIYYMFIDRAADITNLTVYSDTEIVSADSDAAIIVNNNTDGVYSVTYDFTSDNDIRLMLSDDIQKTLKVYQSTLPSLTIGLADGVSLSDLHADKDTKFEGSTVSVSGSEYDISNISDVEIKGRGNTSWVSYDKKGYQIKFSKKQSLLGMDKSKKWVLLANASDPSMLRNKLAFMAGNELNMAFVPDCEYVDLWINGEYRGTYLVTEKVEIGDGRLELSDKGVLYEYDSEFYESEENVLVDCNNNHYVLKDPDVEEASQETIDAFLSKINAFQAEDVTWSEVEELLDTDSFAKMYIVNEYFRNIEYAATSNYMYLDGADKKIAAGPLWDFDTCMLAYSSDGSGMSIYSLNLYFILLNFSQFRAKLTTIYESHKAFFENLPIKEFLLSANIASSARMNEIRWKNMYGYTDIKGNTSKPTWAENVLDEIVWLGHRYERFDPIGIPDMFENMHRLYNPNSGEHFYTSDSAEKDNLVSLGWNYEGISWISPKKSETPVYRLYNAEGGEHHYTTDTDEKDHLISLGWKDEGIGWFSDDTQGVPIYRQYNPNAFSNNHNYTSSKEENDRLVSLGWLDEGISWYGVA